MFFKTKKKIFHATPKGETNEKPYQFRHMIETDGVSCSVVLVRKDLVGAKKIKQKKGPKRQEAYIDDENRVDYEALKTEEVVTIDPNARDLLYCMKGKGKEAIHFRYTQSQRKKETKHKKFRDLRETWKQQKVDEKTVQEWETELSHYNRKTLRFQAFKEYIDKKIN